MVKILVVILLSSWKCYYDLCILISTLNTFLLYLQMPFHAQNPTASYFPLPSVPSKTVVQSMSLRTSHDCKFIQFSFFPNTSFYTFPHTEKAPRLQWGSRALLSAQHPSQPGVKCPEAICSWSVIQKLLILKYYILWTIQSLHAD